MNDRFKFRTVNMETKEIIYVDNYYWFEENGITEIDNNGTASGHTGEYWINQCTGLKDKNGKLIYEGDILSKTKIDWKYEEYTRKYLVCWDRTQWQLGLFKYQRPKAQNNRRYDRKIPLKDIVSFEDYTPFKEFAECEVIGNIYENKELLDADQA